MKFKLTNKLLISWMLILLMIACSPPKKISVYDLSYLYVTDGKFTELVSDVYHASDSVSYVYVEVTLPDLHYVRPDYSDNYQVEYHISYRLMESYESKVIIDSATHTYIDSLNFGRDARMMHVIEIPARYPDKYVLELELLDVNREESIKDFIWVNKEDKNSPQNFLLLNRSNRPAFTTYVGNREKFRIKVNDNDISMLYVRAYFRDFPFARPPFVQEKMKSFDYKADSIFQVPVYNGETDWVQVEREGFYHFQRDTTQRKGMTVFRFYDDYPDLVTAGELAAPLRYITTKKEFEELSEAVGKKEALDKFWLKTAGSAVRAKSLIQKYYNNVQDANFYFTSYLEGWKSDRGLIYIVFGRPGIVYRGYGQEEWVYGDPDHRNSLRFTFVKVNNPFTSNDYMLLRSPTFKDPWYITVQSWRR